MTTKIVTDIAQPGRRRVVIDVPTSNARVEFEARVNDRGTYDVTCLYWHPGGCISVKEMEGAGLERAEVKARWERLKAFYNVITAVAD